MSFLEAQVSFHSNFVSILSAMKHNSSVLSKVKNYILSSKAAHLSANFWDFRVHESKFLIKFLMSILNRQVNPFSNFASFFIVITQNFPVSFKLIYLLCIKGPNESPNFENFVCSSEKSPNSSCHFLNHKSVFLQILHHTLVSWNITPLYLFSSKVIYFGLKQPIKVPIFETFKFSSQNASNFLCQFWNNKSVPLQIFHHFHQCHYT